MNLVIRDLPEKVWENLNNKAKASGRTVEAEAKAILAGSLGFDKSPDMMDDLQKMVWEAFDGKLPANAVDEFLAERRLESQAECRKLESFKYRAYRITLIRATLGKLAQTESVVQTLAFSRTPTAKHTASPDEILWDFWKLA